MTDKSIRISLHAKHRYQAFGAELVSYTTIFLCFIGFVLWCLHHNHLNIISTWDAHRQHIAAFIYIGCWYRELLSHVLQGIWHIPQFYFPLNLGVDSFYTFAHYGFGDPFLLLSICFNPNNAYHGYLLVWVLRLYAAGLSFFCCMRPMQQSIPARLAGSFVYISSFFLIAQGAWHPQFICGAIYLPLAIRAVYRCFSSWKGAAELALIFALTISSCFYFSPINFLACILAYAAISLSSATTGRNVTALPKDDDRYVAKIKLLVIRLVQPKVFFRCAIAHLLGLGMAGVWTATILFSFSESSRSLISSQISAPFLLNHEEILEMLAALIGPVLQPLSHEYLPVLGVAPLALLLYLFMAWLPTSSKQIKKLALSLGVIGFIGLCSPRLAMLLNFNMYVSYRWVYLVALLIAGATTYTLAHLFQYTALSSKHIPTPTSENISASHVKPNTKNLLVKLGCLLLCVALITWIIRQANHQKLVASALLISLFIGALTLGYLLWWSQTNRTDRTYIHALPWLISAMLATQIALIPFCAYSSYNNYRVLSNDTLEQIKHDIGMDKTKVQTASDMHLFQRTGTASCFMQNRAVVTGQPSSTGYYSYLNMNYAQFIKALGYAQATVLHQVSGTDDRAALNAFLSVTTLQQSADYPSPSPDTTTLPTIDNACWAPFGIAYTSTVSLADFMQLNPVEREQLLLHSLVTDEPHTSLQHIKPHDIMSFVNHHAQPSPISERTIDGNSVSFKCTTRAQQPLYLLLTTDPTHPELCSGWIQTQNGTQNFSFESTKSMWFYGQNSIVLNLGTSEIDKTVDITVVLSDPHAHAESLQISPYTIDYSDLPNQIAAASPRQITPFSYRDNNVTGEIAVDTPHAICFTIPFSKGWSATVDGEPQAIYRAQIGFIGLDIPTGKHRIELYYHTPGLHRGLLIAIISWICWIGLILWIKRYPSAPA